MQKRVSINIPKTMTRSRVVASLKSKADALSV